mmetsp:Transcript_15237/g.21883  ORF Transcript_15237/g.21883 Transcript_15237/m.21883 type:complete len:399 (-) Transcript_15237:41-1237(-)
MLMRPTRVHILLTIMAVTSNAIQSINALRVAVLGSGISGSAAARTLAEKGVKVTLFEAGRGVGGRMSTRRTRDEHNYQFDHGAQYIGSPKTDTFRHILDQWKSDDWVREWEGDFWTVGTNGRSQEIKKDRWVGYPTMNSICQNLLSHENIEIKTQTRANASRIQVEDSDFDDACMWHLSHHKTNEGLGSFDWLVASDRNSAGYHRKDLAKADVREFTSGITRNIKSVKSLTAMVVFENMNVNFNGIQFDGKDPKFGSLGWAARDTSKPGREREDDRECWVLQSHPDAAKELLKGKRNIGAIREMARDVLVRDFLNSMPHIVDDDEFELPRVVTSVGHRWGAAFPIPSEKSAQMESQIIASKQFVACGDYFGQLSGRIEGGYLSGVSAADQLCGAIEIN